MLARDRSERRRGKVGVVMVEWWAGEVLGRGFVLHKEQSRRSRGGGNPGIPRCTGPSGRLSIVFVKIHEQPSLEPG